MNGKNSKFGEIETIKLRHILGI